MEEQEVPVEHLHDIVHEHGHKITWAEKVALTTALFAVFAAISSLLSTHESDKAILLRVESSDQWSYYQAKGIKGMITENPSEKTRYEQEQENIRKEAEAKTEASEHAMHIHEYCAYAVTIFQVATALGAIGVLVKRRPIWYTSMALGIVGVGLLIKAMTLF
jgi:cytochrome oxidase assembly protein ShyY1